MCALSWGGTCSLASSPRFSALQHSEFDLPEALKCRLSQLSRGSVQKNCVAGWWQAAVSLDVSPTLAPS